MCLKEKSTQQQQAINQSSEQNVNVQKKKDVEESAVDADLDKLNEIAKLEMEIIENLKKLIKNFDNKGGLWARTIPHEYKKMFNKELNVNAIGYRYPIDLLDEKLGDFIITKRPEKYGDHLLFSIDSKIDGDSNQEDSQDDDVDELTYINNLRQLSKEIRRLFKRDPLNFERNKFYSIAEFKDIFEEKAGWRLYLKHYGCKTLDQLMMKLIDEKLFELKYDTEKKMYIKYKPEPNEIYVATSRQQNDFNMSKYSVSEVATNDNKTSGVNGVRIGSKNDGEDAIFMERFINEFVFYNETLDPYSVLKDIDLTAECDIIVSHVLNPFEMSIQIAKNVPKLNSLMDDLEDAYLGVGASHWNMKSEHIQIGKYCAAVFPGDKNWHRCKILEIDERKKLVRVSFIDYGGEAMVPMKELKFLLRRFMDLPHQAVLARLSNVDYMVGKRWANDITEYLLNIVKGGKIFKAKFDGTVFSHLSMTVYELDRSFKVIDILNKKIVREGYATEMKDKLIVNKIFLFIIFFFLTFQILL